MSGIVKKVRSITTNKHLKFLIEEYVDIRAKIESQELGTQVESDVLGAFAMGPAFPGSDSVNRNLSLMYERWSEETTTLQTKAHHHVYTMHPDHGRGVPTGALSRYVVSYSLGAIRAFQAWARPDALLSLIAGFHGDRDHPHAHVLVMPQDSKGRALNFTRLARVRGPNGTIHVDYQGYLQKAYHDYLTHFEAPDALFEHNPSLAVITPKLHRDDWLCALHATFNAPGDVQLTSEELLARFESSKRDFQARIKTADAIRQEVRQMRAEIPDQATAKELAKEISQAVDASRVARDKVIAATHPAPLVSPESGKPSNRVGEPESIRERLRKVRLARIETDLHRLRSTYARLRICQLTKPERLDPVPSASIKEDGKPLDRVIERCLVRMQQLTDDRRVFQFATDTNVLLSPFEAKQTLTDLENEPVLTTPDGDLVMPAAELAPSARLPAAFTNHEWTHQIAPPTKSIPRVR